VLGVSQLAGIMGAKQASNLIPLCHPLLLSHVDTVLRLDDGDGAVDIEATVKTVGPTGVEMEALTAVSVAALTVYDMCKAASKDIRITDVFLVEKVGGKSGHWRFDRDR
jgi:cyclic pyranopterin monophosphate synthase